MLLDALPAEHTDVWPAQRRGTEELFREARLADAGLARDEHGLSSTLARQAESFMEPVQLPPTSDERETDLAAASRRQRLGIDADGGPLRLIPDTLDRSDEPKTAPVDGLDEPWCSRVVSQGPAQLAYRFREGVIRDCGFAPDFLVKGLLGDEETGPLDEIAEHIPRLGPQRDLTFSPP
jgi:hypothetical protein